MSDVSKHTGTIIIGGGLTGLTLAFELHRKKQPFILLEKENRLGGVIQTHQNDGFIFESGPNTGVLANPETVELFEGLKGNCKLEIANPDAKKRLIWKNNRWHALPSGPLSAIQTPLFKAKDKWRVLMEPFRQKGHNPDETLADMVKRRLGKSFLDYAVDPFISGIYAGDSQKLVTRHAMPKLYNLEQQYGSFIKGAVKKKKTEREKKATREVFSFEGGLENMISALVNTLPAENIFTGVNNLRTQKTQNGFSITFESKTDNYAYTSDSLATTVSAYALKDILSFAPANHLQAIGELTYAPVVQLIMGYRQWNGMSLKAFGGLVPSCENRDILGVLFPSSCFAGRAPSQGALLSVFAGGMRKPEWVNLDEGEISKKLIPEALQMVGCHQQPDMAAVFKYPKAIPQYDAGMDKRLHAIVSLENQFPGLYLAGNIKDGIGMANRIQQAVLLAEKIALKKNKSHE